MILDPQTSEQLRRPLLARWINTVIRVFDRQPDRILSFARSGDDQTLHPEILRGLAKLAVSLDRTDLTQAFGYYQQAIDAVSESDAAYRAAIEFEIGTLHTMAGETDAALAAFEDVLQVLPDHVLALNNYAYLLAEERNNPTAALDPATRAAAAAPDNASVRDTLGRVHFLLGHYDQAATELQASLDITESPGVLVHLAEVEIARERYDAARSLLARARQMQPDSELEADIQRLSDDIRTRTTGS